MWQGQIKELNKFGTKYFHTHIHIKRHMPHLNIYSAASKDCLKIPLCPLVEAKSTLKSVFQVALSNEWWSVNVTAKSR